MQRGSDMAVGKAVALLFVLLVSTCQATAVCHSKHKEGAVCPRRRNIEIRYKPYYETFFDKNGSSNSLYPQILRNASWQCCNSSRLKFSAVNSSNDVEELIEHKSCEKDEHNDTGLTFFFPVFVKRGRKVAFDDEYQFLELDKSPGPVVMMLTSEKNKMKVTASEAVRESWPLFVLILSLAATVGLLGWLLDHSSTPSQFSLWFYKGAWEGFWWAMVTITTVGYGDKVPVAFFSRVLAILWMICGAIILSLFTANVTSVLTSNQMDDTKSLIGRKIAVLNSKHYFESNLNVGGSIKEFSSQEEMFGNLTNGNVNRLLVPNYFDIGRMEEVDSKLKQFTVVDVINEPFLTGLALANKHTDEDKAFLTCLKKKVKSFGMIPSKDAPLPQSSDSSHRTTMLFQQDIVMIILYNIIGIGVFAGVGIFLDIIRCLTPNKSKRKRSLAEDVELKRLDSNV